MSDQKTIVAHSVEALDEAIIAFKKFSGARVFATHTDWKLIIHEGVTVADRHKVTLFYDVGTISEDPKEEPKDPYKGLGSETAQPPAHKQEKRVDFGAAWIDKKDSKMLNIKKDSGGYMSIPEADLIFNDGETYWVDPDEEIKLYFTKTNSNTPNFPKYKVYK